MNDKQMERLGGSAERLLRKGFGLSFSQTARSNFYRHF